MTSTEEAEEPTKEDEGNLTGSLVRIGKKGSGRCGRTTRVNLNVEIYCRYTTIEGLKREIGSEERFCGLHR